jgi:hypothetical protein
MILIGIARTLMSDPPPSRGFHLLDLSALVVGYGLAALLIRAFWPSGEEPAFFEMTAIALVYLWLGLAMSGPIVLLIRRPAPAAPPVEIRGAAPEARTWAELAWLIIGFYWIVLTILVVPVKLHRSPLHDATLIGLLPVAAAGVLRLFDRTPVPSRPDRGPLGWTHHAAVGLLLTWPLAWIALILLGKSLL